MAGETKTLTFSEGVAVDAPTQSFLSASAIETYANDAAYEAAKGGVGTEGDIYGNTTTNIIRYHDGTTWINVPGGLNNFTAVSDPTVNDDQTLGYRQGSIWVRTDVSPKNVYIALSVSTGAASWLEVGKPIIGVKEIPAGLVNGINKDYTITVTPVDGTLAVLRNGSVVPESELSFAHPVISFTDAPSVGQIIEAYYLTNGSAATVQLNASNHVVENREITAGEIVAKQLTLTNTPAVSTKVIVDVRGGSVQVYGLDFIVTGAILDWSGYDLDGQIIAGSILRIQYYI